MKAFHRYSKEKQQPFTIYGRLFFANLLSCFKKYLRIKDESRQAVREQAGFGILCWFGLRGQAALEYFILTFLIIGIVFVALGETGVIHWGRQGGKLLFCKALRKIFGEVPCDCSYCGPEDICSTSGWAYDQCAPLVGQATKDACDQYANGAAPIYVWEKCWEGGPEACSWGYSQYWGGHYNECVCQECNPHVCGPHGTLEYPRPWYVPGCCTTRGECYFSKWQECMSACRAKCEECL